MLEAWGLAEEQELEEEAAAKQVTSEDEAGLAYSHSLFGVEQDDSGGESGSTWSTADSDESFEGFQAGWFDGDSSSHESVPDAADAFLAGPVLPSLPALGAGTPGGFPIGHRAIDSTGAEELPATLACDAQAESADPAAGVDEARRGLLTLPTLV
jgi:hypothetical protein